MNAKETIASWRWRIVKAGHNAKSFAAKVGVSQSLMSEYLSGKKSPSIQRFDMIETTLREILNEKGE